MGRRWRASSTHPPGLGSGTTSAAAKPCGQRPACSMARKSSAKASTKRGGRKRNSSAVHEPGPSALSSGNAQMPAAVATAVSCSTREKGGSLRKTFETKLQWGGLILLGPRPRPRGAGRAQFPRGASLKALGRA